MLLNSAAMYGQKRAGDAAARENKTGTTKEEAFGVMKKGVQQVGAREREVFA